MPAQPSLESTVAAAPPRATPVRWFGRFQLLRLLGKSERTMAWRVADSRSQHELVLMLPRVQPADAAALDRWRLGQRQAARLAHPQLAAVVDTGAHDGWPFIAYDPQDHATLGERMPALGMPGLDAAALACQALQGLAFAHEGGVAHQDLQPYMLLVSDTGSVRVAGLGVATDAATATGAARQLDISDTGALRLQRGAAERDVFACGLLLHVMLTGQPVLDEADIGRLIQRMSPQGGTAGRDIVRLPWTLAHPVAEPLRAIVNRATERQERQRYRSARTFIRALDGWRQTEADSGGGPLALLADRLRSAGMLPSLPGAAARAARLAMMERERTNELAEVVLEDPALTFELLRLVNASQLRSSHGASSGAVLTVRRAIAMLGLDGVRRAALGLRAWPGPLDEAGATELRALVERCKRAARVALALRPDGYDAEVVSLITLLQNLGRLVVQYHFADEAVQIRRLMQPAPPARAGEPEEPGMGEEAASFAVLGADTEAIGAAVARHCGLDDSVLAMVRRQPLTTPVRGGEGDDGEMLRMLASCANEAVDALSLPGTRVMPALQRVLQRYGRVLDITGRDLQAALQGKGHSGGQAIGQAVGGAHPD